MTHISPGATAIAAERRRQIEAEGWTPEHDDEHISAQLIDAANCYLFAARWTMNADEQGRIDLLAGPPAGWPWDKSWWKPSTEPTPNLVKAGALIAAEIDRVRRRDIAAAQGEPPPPVTADIARAWRQRDWPGQTGSTPPPYYLELWRDYLGTDEGRRRYPGGGRLPDGTMLAAVEPA